MEKLLQDRKACVAFHGHECKGLAIGFAAVRLARELLSLNAASSDEEIVCVSGNNACGVDAVQVLLSCTAGKGNLLFRVRGKQAFSFFIRDTQKAVRLALKHSVTDNFATPQELAFVDPKTLFDIKEPPYALPAKAIRMAGHACEVCGESTAESHLRLAGGKVTCSDCAPYFSRYNL